MIVLIIVICAAALLAAFAAFAWFSNNALQVTNFTVRAPKNLKIVHLSDLHGKKFGKGNVRLLKKVAELSPDIIAFTGDIVHLYTRKNVEAALEAMRGLVKIAPVYFVAGNHEMRNKKYRELKSRLVSIGVTVLDDERVTLNNGMVLAGVNCASLKNGGAQRALKGAEGYKILLAHEPQYFEQYFSAGADIALCGHAHGGQWRVPFTNRGIYAPGQGMFPKYTGGAYKKNGFTMILSRGLGNSEFPLRLFNRPEIVCVNLVCCHCEE